MEQLLSELVWIWVTVKVWQLEVNVVHHVALHWMWGQLWLCTQPFSNVSASLGGSTEERGAGLPSHLEGVWDYNHWLSIWIVGLWEHIAEVLLLVWWDHHSPEAILDVYFGKDNRS